MVLAAGCAGTSGLVDRIELFKATDNLGVPTAASLAVSDKDPEPGTVWEFSPEDKIFFGIRLNKDLEENIVFTKYTFYNRDTSAESEVGLPEQLGPFEPGQIPLVAFDSPWTLPEPAGSYEFAYIQKTA